LDLLRSLLVVSPPFPIRRFPVLRRFLVHTQQLPLLLLLLLLLTPSNTSMP
jgi:hypothetical protein